MSARDEERPKYRGIPDVFAVLGLSPVVFALVWRASPEGRVPAIIYGLSLLGLFGVSACYHAMRWGPIALGWWRRLDHSMIYVLIAASYVPVAMGILEGHERTIVLWMTWGGAGLGVLKTFFWSRAPRIMTAPIYIVLGWCIVPFADTVYERMDGWTFFWFLGGGVLYSLGGVVYATRTPDPSPKVFGYHEVMHLFIIAAACAQVVAQWRLTG